MKPTFDITRFCGKYDARSHLKQPIVNGGFIYATNGHICVRVPALATDADTPLTGEQPAKVLASPSRIGKRLHHRDGRVTDLNGNAL